MLCYTRPRPLERLLSRRNCGAENLAKLKSRLFDARRRWRYGGVQTGRTRLARINEGPGDSSDGSTPARPPGCAFVALAMHDDAARRPATTSGLHLICTPRCLSRRVATGLGTTQSKVDGGRCRAELAAADKRLCNLDQRWRVGARDRRHR